ncbi:MAG: glycosyltransferase [Chitinophagaceae bacterium]|jgi:glycosyltransferase involved in cell wall biosynthesis|nr:glycosyltransferase [Chitinophagaceae bacterium]NBY24547.1 glycosyltransferase [Chitinophagaceae bacterium]NCW87883.1 glycosyltransferase [Chitinophagia bacterium]NDB53911.1 glycosyltransferase [Chitinophagaceae bacterium]NDE78575.1 glycosyltransferase [Chitinophagaceae bacterium]
MDLSIVIPLLNEADSLPELTEWIEQVMQREKTTYEVIYIDDGSTDNSWAVIESLRERNSNVKGIKFQRNYGKSAALQVGFTAAQGDIVVTMDADLQDSPEEIPEMRTMILNGGYDLVSGWKKIRYDNTFTKNIPSKFFNAVTRKMSGIALHDFNCGLKAYRKNVVKSIEVYGEMHRYIPVLAKWSGYKKIGEKVVEHRKRKHGVSKFGWDRFINGFLDLLSITFVGRFSKRPMHFFGLWGSVCFLAGFFVSTYLIISKIVDSDFALTNRPGFYIALTLIMIGMQLFLAGYLGELIARNSSTRNHYLIETQTGL